MIDSRAAIFFSAKRWAAYQGGERGLRIDISRAINSIREQIANTGSTPG